MARQNLTEGSAKFEIKESGKLAQPPEQSGKMLAQIITPGTGSSGTYPATVLEAAAKARLIKAGTPMYMDHPTESEAYERPGRSVRDMVAVFTEDARWTGDALVAEAQVFSPYRPLLSEMAPYIGLSIHGTGTISEGVVESLEVIDSVDFVTAAGRGGKVLQMMESARRETRTLSETSASDAERSIRDAVNQAYSDSKKQTYAWVRDYDPDQKLVYFELDVAGVCTTYQQTYEIRASGDVELAGDKAEVNQRTVYILVDATASESATPNVPRHAPGQPTTIRENTMPENEGATTPIEESKRRELEEKAGRVDIAEAKLASETARADKAEQALAVETAKEYARDFGITRVRKANSELAGPVVEKIVAEAMREIPLTEAEKAADRRLDTEAFGARVDEARKEQELYLATVIENSAGTVRGLGPVAEKKEVTRADSDKAIAEAFGYKVKEA